MSIRHELAQVIAVALAETNPSGLGTFDELSPNRQKQLLSRGGHAADAILARYGVVELPEPDGRAEGGEPYWDSTDYVEVEGSRVYLIGSTGYRSLAYARALAGALLAAANRAEAADVDR